MHWDQHGLVSGPQPLWWQIADRLRREIEFGGFKPGEALPSETLLNQVFGVSRTTARTALDKLEQEGLISRRAGKGSIVLPPQVVQPLSQMSSFAEDMQRRGFSAGYQTLGARMAVPPADIAAALRLQPNEKAFMSTRLLKADDMPMAYSHSWLSPALFVHHPTPGADDLDRQSLYVWLEQRCGCRIVGGQETISAALLNGELSRALQVARGSACLVARRLSYDADQRPVEYVTVHYRADRYSFTIDLVRKS
ncbi:GntR family transcriptional regulator [Sodalis sp. RH24]|uniref:GntR family transcriptional regulator n=1 Tax=unclassified Sodalis (in: enterobacteria) TaxID=2636512 RepID=UPI0039B63732